MVHTVRAYKFTTTAAGADIPLPVLDLLQDCKAIEDSGGGWNGGDIVDAATAWFTRHGVDVEATVGRFLAGEQRYRCERCGDPFTTAEETVLCPACERNNDDRVMV